MTEARARLAAATERNAPARRAARSDGPSSIRCVSPNAAAQLHVHVVHVPEPASRKPRDTRSGRHAAPPARLARRADRRCRSRAFFVAPRSVSLFLPTARIALACCPPQLPHECADVFGRLRVENGSSRPVVLYARRDSRPPRLLWDLRPGQGRMFSGLCESLPLSPSFMPGRWSTNPPINPVSQ